MAEITDTNTAIVAAICQCLSNRDVDGVLSHVAEDARWTIVGRKDRFAFGGPSDREGTRAILTGFLGGFAEFEFVVRNLTAQDDRVVVQAASHGTGSGGASYRNTYLMHYRLRDGKVVEVFEYFDPFEVLAYIEQLAPEMSEPGSAA